jgi:ABC-2 type transport system ATP-binding protein
LIQVRGLTKLFPDGSQALRGIDLDFGEGMLGILGPNGAGKTTLLSILVLALQATGGTVRYDSLDPTRRSDRAAILGAIGYLPQQFAPIGRLTGLEYLLHCARLRRVAMSGAELGRVAWELLEAVSMTHAAHRRCGEYSGGMKRRIGLAQALVHGPRLLVVDEPTSGLDPEERLRFRNLVSEVAEQMAVLLSTHIVEDIEATCPRLAIIAEGRLLFDGEPTTILRGVGGHLWEIPDTSEPVPGLPVVARRMDRDGQACRIVRADSAVPGARPVEANLELAYAAFLSAHGQSAGEEAVRP